MKTRFQNFLAKYNLYRYCVASPADISMDSVALTAATGVVPRCWEEQVKVALAL
jgi:hypothetical protein